MSEPVIYDANFLVALIAEFDKWHREATHLHALIKSSGWDIVYFDCVANEVISVLARRYEEKGRHQEFEEVLRKFKLLIPKKDLTWIYPDVERHYDRILDVMKRSLGKLNFHDALIAVAAEEWGVKYIVSFDEDFDRVDCLVRIKDETLLEVSDEA